jgi:predicted hydrocarbon binding protein
MTDLAPGRFNSSEFGPGRKLAQFALKLRNEPGTLEALSAIATRNRVNILSGSHDAPPNADHGAWSFFADMTDSKQSAEQLAKEFSSLPGTLDVKFKTATTLIVDTFHFPLFAGDQQVMVLATRSIAAIFLRVKELLGAGPATNVLLHQIGQATGKTNFELMLSKIDKETLLSSTSEIAGLWSAAGWGMQQIKEFELDRMTARIEIQSNFECSSYGIGSETPQSQFVRGCLSGYWSGFFQRRINAEETRCIAKGDGVCEFLLTPA